MRLDSLAKLFVHELKDLHSAESQIVEALPKMMSACHDPDLKGLFEEHLKETREHVKRLERIFSKLQFSPKGHKCQGMAGLLKESAELMQSDAEPEVLDAALIAAAHRVEHYEIAGYGTARAYAEKLGDYEAADLLQETLDEEGHADSALARLAERKINFEAMVAGREPSIRRVKPQHAS